MPSFPFEELMLEVDGIFVGCFSGECELSDDGRIELVTLDGWRGSGVTAMPTRIHLTVPVDSLPSTGTWRDQLSRVLASDLEKQFADVIRETMMAHEAARRFCGREYDANEAA